MIFNKHYELKNRHAILSPSSPAWLRYDSEKLLNFRLNLEAKRLGTRLHEWACETIKLGIEQSGTDALSLYINDAIKYHMTPEQPLHYSDDCFGTADTISFEDSILRVSDYKSGTVKMYEPKQKDFEQLLVYAALFCLEYRIKPNKISTELRVYQAEGIIEYTPEPEEIILIMNVIENHAVVLSKINKGGFLNDGSSR